MTTSVQSPRIAASGLNPKSRTLLLLAVLGAGLFLRFWGLSSSAPGTGDVRAAETILQIHDGRAGGESPPSVHPGRILFPVLVLKGISLFLSAVYWHKEASPYPFTFEQALLISRIASAFLGFLCLPALYIGLKRLFREKEALMGTFLFAVAAVPAVESGRPDSAALLILMVLLSVGFSAAVFRSGKPSASIMAGLFAGFAAACDIRGALAAGVIITTHPAVKKTGFPFGLLSIVPGYIAGRLIFALAGFSWDGAFAAAAASGAHTAQGAAAAGFPGIFKSTAAAFLSGEGTLYLIAVLFGLAGLAGCLLRRKSTPLLVLFLFPVLYATAVLLFGRETRGDLAVLSPFIAAASGLGLSFMTEILRSHKAAVITRAAVVLLFAALSVQAVVEGYRRWDDDAAAIARRWIARNPPGEPGFASGDGDRTLMKVIRLKEGRRGDRTLRISGPASGETAIVRGALPEVPWPETIPREFEILDGSPYGKETKSFRITEGKTVERILISETPLKTVDLFFLSNQSDGAVTVRSGFRSRKIRIEKGRDVHVALTPRLSFPFHRYRYGIRIKASKDLAGSFVRIVPDPAEAERRLSSMDGGGQWKSVTSAASGPGIREFSPAGEIDLGLFTESKSLYLEAEAMDRNGGRLVVSDRFSGGQGVLFSKDTKERNLAATGLDLYPGRYRLQIHVSFPGEGRNLETSVTLNTGEETQVFTRDRLDITFSGKTAVMDFSFEIRKLGPLSVGLALGDGDTVIVDVLKLSPVMGNPGT